MQKINYKKGFGPLAIILAVVVIAALGGGAYYSSQKSAPVDEAMVNSSADVKVEAETSSSGSIRNLLALGKDLMCTIDQSTASSTVKGTMYISGDMMNGEFTTSVSGSAGIVSNMIKSGETMYVWSGTQGMKMTVDTSASASTQNKNNVDLDQEVDYKCSAWRVDNSKFTPPAAVKFTDMSAMMNSMNSQINTSTGASVSAQCGVCNSLSGESKTQCLTAMNCK